MDPTYAAGAFYQHLLAVAGWQTMPLAQAVQRSGTPDAYGRWEPDAAAGILAERAGLPATDPEPRIAAAALVGLWQVQFRSISRHLAATHTPEHIQAAVTADVERAARLLQNGLGAFATHPQDPPAPRNAQQAGAAHSHATIKSRGEPDRKTRSKSTERPGSS